MANLVQWIEEEAAGEEILSLVIGAMGWGDFGSEAVAKYEEQPRGKLLDWSDGKKYIDYEFDSGYGAPGCNAIYVWTTNHVIAISQYDGSTSSFKVPRNPVDCVPEMPGG